MADEREERVINRLLASTETGCGECASYIAALDPLFRTELLQALLFERLERKLERVKQLREEAYQNWNQTFYLLYFRTLGDSQNQENYLDLARRVPYRYLLRERTTPHAVEAMLLGASGLLSLYEPDEYCMMLHREYTHLAAKYQLETMSPTRWVLHDIRPANHPVLRLAQAAEFFSQSEFVMERVLECKTEEELRRLFCVECTDYWRTHYIPGSRSDARPKRLGLFKAHIIGINLVTILQFSYGAMVGSEEMRDGAFSLLDNLPAEDNRYMRLWRSGGLTPRDAFESQALLQLSTEYCQQKRCRSCQVARRMLYQLHIGR